MIDDYYLTGAILTLIILSANALSDIFTASLSKQIKVFIKEHLYKSIMRLHRLYINGIGLITSKLAPQSVAFVSLL